MQFMTPHVTESRNHDSNLPVPRTEEGTTLPEENGEDSRMERRMKASESPHRGATSYLQQLGRLKASFTWHTTSANHQGSD